MDAAGDCVVAWQSAAQDGNGYGVYARRYSAAGVPLGGEFQANQNNTNDQTLPAVGMVVAGDFVVAWQSVGVDSSGLGVAARRYGADGSALGGEFVVNTTATGQQRDPSVAMDASGAFIVTWASDQEGN